MNAKDIAETLEKLTSHTNQSIDQTMITGKNF